MKNLVLLMVAVLMLGIAASAQSEVIGITGKGVKLGFGFSAINTDYDDLDEFLDSRVGFSGGAFLTYGLNRQFSVQPELLYVSKGAEKDLFFFSPYWSIDYLEIPVLLKFDLMPDGSVHPNLFIGPAASILLSSKIGILNESLDVGEGMKSLDFGLVFGGGLDYKHITFDIRYTLGLANTIDADKVNALLTAADLQDYLYLEGDPSVKNTDIVFMFGVRF